jgi:hypothetical protein
MLSILFMPDPTVPRAAVLRFIYSHDGVLLAQQACTTVPAKKTLLRGSIYIKVFADALSYQEKSHLMMSIMFTRHTQ